MTIWRLTDVCEIPVSFMWSFWKVLLFMLFYNFMYLFIFTCFIIWLAFIYYDWSNITLQYLLVDRISMDLAYPYEMKIVLYHILYRISSSCMAQDILGTPGHDIQLIFHTWPNITKIDENTVTIWKYFWKTPESWIKNPSRSFTFWIIYRTFNRNFHIPES